MMLFILSMIGFVSIHLLLQTYDPCPNNKKYHFTYVKKNFYG